MPELTISVPTAGVKLTEKASIDKIKKQYGISDDDFNDMALAELGARLSGAVKRAIAATPAKLSATPTDDEVRTFLGEWDGLGGRKGNALTKYTNMVKAGTSTQKELDAAADEAADFILSKKSGSGEATTSAPSA